MNKKHALLLLMLLPLALGLSARPVDMSTAMQEAKSFLMQQRGGNSALKVASKAPRLLSTGDQSYYYVFNIDGGGFVIVSGDDRTVPILGYSDEGSFDENKIPANMKAWLGSYAEQIKALDKMSDSQVASMLAAPRNASVPTRNSIAPMITTRWDQARPYWNKCPEFMDIDENGDTVGELAYTGCVATSMSQVMKYHNWPLRPTKTIPSYQLTIASGEDYNVTYDFVMTDSLPVIDFDWAHMLDSYTGGESEVYTDAVANLMVYAGYAVKMQYGTSSSAAYTDDILPAFTKYFAYDKSKIQLVFRTDYTQDVWDDMIYNELAEGRPMVYNGTAGSGGGHSFVCDGYEYGNYFHINWGWGGMGNGYFQLAILNPRESGIGGSSSAEGYNMKQSAIIGITPGDPEQGEDPDPEVEYALTATGFSLGFSGTMERDSKSQGFNIYKRKTFRLNYADHMSSGKRFDVGLALYDTDHNFVQLIINQGNYLTALTSAQGSFYEFGSNISDARNGVRFGAGLTGDYLIVPVYQLEGTTDWKPMLESDRFYMECTMTNYEASFTSHPIVDLVATNFEFTGGEKVGKPEQVHVTLQNNSADRFFGNLFLFFGGQQIDMMGAYTTEIQAEVLAGQSNVVTFNVTPESSGTKSVYVALDDIGSNRIPGTGQVIIEDYTELPTNLAVTIQAENATGNTIYDSYARFKVDITNNGESEYNKYVLAPLFLVSKDDQGNVLGGQMVTYGQSSLSVAPGQTETLYFEFYNLGYDQTYSLNIYARNEQDQLVNIVEKGSSVYYDIKHGMVVWTRDDIKGMGMAAEGDIVVPDNAIAVRLDGLNINSVTPNANPNTMYIIGVEESIPNGLEEKNVIVGNQAQSIALRDGYDYFTPVSFTTQSISYIRAFNSTRTAPAANGWNTIVLPFTPELVKDANGNALTAATSADEAADLWIARFAAEEDSVPTFAITNQITANVPYAVAVKSGLNGKEVTWSAGTTTLKAEPIAMTSGQNYVLTGTFMGGSLESIFALNAAGTGFEPVTAATAVDPFRAYFTALAGAHQLTFIPILGEGVVNPVITGDVNNDGAVDGIDLNILINIVLGHDSADNYDGRANVDNSDNVVNGSDINAMINLLLNK